WCRQPPVGPALTPFRLPLPVRAVTDGAMLLVHFLADGELGRIGRVDAALRPWLAASSDKQGSAGSQGKQRNGQTAHRFLQKLQTTRLSDAQRPWYRPVRRNRSHHNVRPDKALPSLATRAACPARTNRPAPASRRAGDARRR